MSSRRAHSLRASESPPRRRVWGSSPRRRGRVGPCRPCTRRIASASPVPNLVTVPASVFLQLKTLRIIGLAIVAFAFGTAGGLWAAKLVNLFLKEKINPMIGAAGVSAIPMSARVVQKMGQQANPRNFLIMHAMGPNMAGAVSTSVVAGIFLGMLL